MWFNKKVEVKPIEIKLTGELDEILKFFRIFLVNYLIGKENDLKKLKIELMRPVIEDNFLEGNAKQAERINQALASKGDKVRKAWEKYKDEKLTLQRENKDTKLVDAKLEILDILME